MQKRVDFTKESLETNLFFLRIMKEHLTFAAGALTLRDYNMINPLMDLIKSYDQLLINTISMANGSLSPQSLQAGDIITPYTLSTEVKTQNLIGLPINTEVTKLEAVLINKPYTGNRVNEQAVYALNQQIIALLRTTIKTQESLLNDVIACKKFVFLPTLMLEHVNREAEHYLEHLESLQNGKSLLDSPSEILMHEGFWDNIMSEHAMFMRDLIDPTEEELKKTANEFAIEFKELTEAAKKAIRQLEMLPSITARSLNATVNLRNFKQQATAGNLECKVRSIIIPLLSDHVLREANHFIKSLRMLH